MKKLLLLLVLPFLFTVNAFSQKYTDYQDVVYLKNGTVIRGIIIEQIPFESIKIETKGGSVFVYTLDEIEKITKEPKFEQESRVSTPSIGLKKGYRGIVEFGVEYYYGARLSIINGYQFNPYVSLGLGTGLNWCYPENLYIPVFADLRVNFLNKRVSPYTSLDVGYSFALGEEASSFFILPIGGVRFKVNERSSINIGSGFGMWILIDEGNYSHFGFTINFLNVGFLF